MLVKSDPTSATTRASQGDHIGCTTVRLVLGALLLVAAALKTHQLATEPVANEDIFTARWFLTGVVELEMFMGVWLIVGAAP